MEGKSGRRSSDPGPVARFRWLLKLLFALGGVATSAELLLLGHTEDRWQLVPLVLLGLGLLGLAVPKLVAGSTGIRSFQFIMVLFMVGGCLGLYWHYEANMEFELEMYPSMKGFELFWETVQGATPALAPAAMIQLGLLGLASTYRHPDLEKRDKQGGTR